MLLGLTVSPARLATGLKGETDVAESGYFAVRWLLAKSVAEAARFIAERGGVAEGAACAGAADRADRL